jgi:hypothetical protein
MSATEQKILTYRGRDVEALSRDELLEAVRAAIDTAGRLEAMVEGFSAQMNGEMDAKIARYEAKYGLYRP